MSVSLERGAFSTALSLSGAGAIIIWPNQWLIGVVLIALGVCVFLGGIKFKGRPWWKRRPSPVLAPPEETPPRIETAEALPTVRTDREKVALVAVRDFLAARIDPFVKRAAELAPWGEFVRSKKRAEAFAALMVFRERILPLATDLLELGRRHKREYAALGISLTEVLARIEALVRPVENLYRPVRKSYFVRLLFWAGPMDAFTGQEEALADRIRELEDCVSNFRAQLEPMLRCSSEAPE